MILSGGKLRLYRHAPRQTSACKISRLDRAARPSRGYVPQRTGLRHSTYAAKTVRQKNNVRGCNMLGRTKGSAAADGKRQSVKALLCHIARSRALSGSNRSQSSK